MGVQKFAGIIPKWMLERTFMITLLIRFFVISLTLVSFFFLSYLANSAVLWPMPVKTFSVLLILLASLALLFFIIVSYKVILQIGIKVTLIAALTILLTLAVFSVARDPYPKAFFRHYSSLLIKPISFVANTYEKYLFQYKGYRKPVLVPGATPSDMKIIPAN